MPSSDESPTNSTRGTGGGSVGVACTTVPRPAVAPAAAEPPMSGNAEATDAYNTATQVAATTMRARFKTGGPIDAIGRQRATMFHGQGLPAYGPPPARTSRRSATAR